MLPMSEWGSRSYEGGLFITLEGTEGSGKSTQAQLLAWWFLSQGYRVVLAGEPGGTAAGKAMRSVFLDYHETMTPTAEIGILLCAKAQLLETVIKPALADGMVVICDRYTDTLYAYQHVGKGHPKELIDRMIQAFDVALDPDATICLNQRGADSVMRSLKRRDEGGEYSNMDAREVEFHERIGQYFYGLSHHENIAEHKGRYLNVSAQGAECQIHQTIVELIQHRFAELPQDPPAPRRLQAAKTPMPTDALVLNLQGARSTYLPPFEQAAVVLEELATAKEVAA